MANPWQHAKLLNQSWHGRYEILGNVNTSQNKRAHIEWVNAYLEEIKYKKTNMYICI